MGATEDRRNVASETVGDATACGSVARRETGADGKVGHSLRAPGDKPTSPQAHRQRARLPKSLHTFVDDAIRTPPPDSERRLEKRLYD
ncbi:Hypothetical protein SMAX5B_013631 [Scophthalmus maximus]|uniref:Uncharacterized protein n=1 Tax=Scophthalmus maximus TaxID=52904 RepID=A0A2U9BEL1_SCOMX|nr:Hypothetical protein SMAX5B_013631 [Scophthalmus maximus]